MSEQEQVVQLLDQGADGLESAVSVLTSGAPVRLKEAAAYLVGEHGGWEHGDLLLQALASPSEQIQQTAIIALQKIVNPPVARREMSGRYLAYPRPRALPPDKDRWCSALRPLLRKSEPQVRARAAETLGWLDDSAAVPHLRRLLSDRSVFVRYYAFEALRVLTGHRWDFLSLEEITARRAPLVTVRRATHKTGAQQMGPFHWAPHLVTQGKFEMLRGGETSDQTLAHAWWQDDQLCLEVDCDDNGAGDDGEDKLIIYLQPEDQPFSIHRLELSAVGGLVEWLFEDIYTLERQRRSGSDLDVSVRRDSQGWTASLRIPFTAFSRQGPPLGEVWGANIIRVESHPSKTETSSWAYCHPTLSDLPGLPRLGLLSFGDTVPIVAFRPEPANMVPFGTGPAATEALTPAVMRPGQMVRGENTFDIMPGPEQDSPASLKVVASAFDGDDLVATTTERLAVQDAQPLCLRIDRGSRARALDLEVAFTDVDSGREVFRHSFTSVPLVSPPARAGPYALQVVEDDSATWPGERFERGRWRLRDLGPMLMSEFYPISLVQGADGLLYGGTFPGGRLFSYDPERGTLDDLGSPAHPMNHVKHLVACPDSRIFGSINHNLFRYDPRTRKTADLGEPVPREIYDSLSALAWAGGRIYGVHQGHLFFVDPDTGDVTSKGMVSLDDEIWLFHSIHADSDGNLLGIVGLSGSGANRRWRETRERRLFRYLPDGDEILLSDVEIDGRLISGPDGKVYALFHDGRLFEWRAHEDRITLAAHYASPTFHDTTTMVLADTGELLIGQNSGNYGSRDLTKLLVYEPGQDEPVDLGNPVPNASHLTALTVASDGTIYGMSTDWVYGVAGTPIYLYSANRF